MAQQHGLGRGLSSLIPPKKDDAKESPFKDMVLRSMEAQGVDLSASRPAQTAPASIPLDPVPTPTAPITAPAVSSSSAKSGSGAGAPMPATAIPSGAPLRVPVGNVVPNPHQPRLRFDEDKLRELADSIREHGVLQPLVVSPLPGGKYELIAGERRLQASKKAGIPDVPVIVRDADERQKLELAIIENIQRHDLDPIEEAKAYARLADEFGLTQEEISRKMGKSRSAVANILRLLTLPVEIQRALSEGGISEGHAKALLSLEHPERQRALFEMIVKTGMTVREAEIKARDARERPYVKRALTLPPEIAEKAERISTALGTKVAVRPAGKGGRIVVEYYSSEELDQIVSRLGV
ncbi:MAG: ParB/RepB/Spo0J family partition protein [Candidatus Moranbacteria bacterium]|nr:ParB/RepB/Spo0J family partition protein [Candidatus Moranbacteria bacterium]NTW46433.1 ParB/RepB/Spo0J family partition protein [Candidatus Moranbacteria bacterium]